MTWDNIIRTISAAVGAAVGFLFGQLNGLFWAVIALMAIDYVTGVLVAVMNKRLSSEVGFRGLVKKLFILVLIAVAHIVDAQIIGQGAATREEYAEQIAQRADWRTRVNELEGT